uniref:Uncharacterized protein n=1 Tax=Leersia perrieri TaxID=77586 RepID=A0A0D9V051_9ORYZ
MGQIRDWNNGSLNSSVAFNLHNISHVIPRAQRNENFRSNEQYNKRREGRKWARTKCVMLRTAPRLFLQDSKLVYEHRCSSCQLPVSQISFLGERHRRAQYTLLLTYSIAWQCYV